MSLGQQALSLAVLRHAYSDLRLHLAWISVLQDAQRRLEHRYRPDQPRAPRGTPVGGQWIFAGGISATRRSAGTRVAQAIEAITKHGIDQIINRGVSPADILDALQNPVKIRRKSNMTTQYIGKGAGVVLNDYGGLVTIWGR
jgi:hypothetical protein